ncbi:DUF551 domain-containing protein [Klebsiella aerogenes]|uniref:DUF551 domain-containing protein n=1 Tax=Klebsiella aerogenes TaxID=548 RepID=UPI001D0D554A|nr:DUF551 domain-containing protein [Klebsiella aerogenes]
MQRELSMRLGRILNNHIVNYPRCEVLVEILRECRAARDEAQAELQERRKADSEPVAVVPEEMPCGGAADDYHDGYQDGWNACRAAMLQAQPSDDGEPTDDERIMAIEGIHNCERCGDEGWVVGEMGITRCACGQAGNSPVIPDRWIPVSERMPENDVSVLTFDGMYKRVHHTMYGHWQCWEPEKITHWMPLPAAPQEVK